MLTIPTIAETLTAPSPKLSQLLPTLFPAVFGNPPAALKFGVHIDLLDALDGKFSSETVSGFLQSHVSTTAYLTAVAAGGMRRTLPGEPVEAVSEADRANAQQWLEHRRLKKEGLKQPRAKRICTLDYKGRADLIKKVKASGRRPSKYALANGMDLLEFERNWCKAIEEQRERHARRANLLLEFEQGAMNEEQFAAFHGLSPVKLARELEKARSYLPPQLTVRSAAS